MQGSMHSFAYHHSTEIGSLYLILGWEGEAVEQINANRHFFVFEINTKVGEEVCWLTSRERAALL